MRLEVNRAAIVLLKCAALNRIRSECVIQDRRQDLANKGHEMK